MSLALISKRPKKARTTQERQGLKKELMETLHDLALSSAKLNLRETKDNTSFDSLEFEHTFQRKD